MKWTFDTGKEQVLRPGLYPIQLRAQRQEVEQPPVFDYDDLMERVGNDQHLLAEIIAMFQSDAPEKLTELEVALSRHDSVAFEHAAHALKGMILNFSAGLAAQTAFSLELLGRANRWMNADELLAKLREQIEDLNMGLDRLITKEAS